MNGESRKEIGSVGEEVAAQFLIKKGFTIIARNYRKPWGEIDIIAERDGTVRFVEVKAVSREMDTDFSRETTGYRPEEQIHDAKLRKVARTAELYMAEHGDNREFQIDAVAVLLNARTRIAKCRLYEQIL